MVRRAAASVFMGGSYVFPGGAVDDCDRGAEAAAALSGADPGELAWRAAALRELAEEAAVFITTPPDDGSMAERAAGIHGTALYSLVVAAGRCFDGAALAYLDNWVTPPGPPRRFDTRFFVAEVPPETEATADANEVTDAVWIPPGAALQHAADGTWEVGFPTRVHLEQLRSFPSARAIVDFARAQSEVPRIAPQLRRDDSGKVSVLMPGDPGFVPEVS